MVDPVSGTLYVYTNATFGTLRCYEEIREAVSITRALRGERVIPLVQLDKRPMETDYGVRSRPHLHILEWRQPLGQSSAPALLTSSPTQSLPATPATTPSSTAPVKPIAIEEVIDDKIPF